MRAVVSFSSHEEEVDGDGRRFVFGGVELAALAPISPLVRPDGELCLVDEFVGKVSELALGNYDP
jgi:hypothetical protein